MRTTATSVQASSPTTCAAAARPSVSVTSRPAAPCTTWLLVMMKPSGVKTKPEPLPAGIWRKASSPPGARRRSRSVSRRRTSMFTTEGLTRRAAAMTARE